MQAEQGSAASTADGSGRLRSLKRCAVRALGKIKGLIAGFMHIYIHKYSIGYSMRYDGIFYSRVQCYADISWDTVFLWNMQKSQFLAMFFWWYPYGKSEMRAKWNQMPWEHGEHDDKPWDCPLSNRPRLEIAMRPVVLRAMPMYCSCCYTVLWKFLIST